MEKNYITEHFSPEDLKARCVRLGAILAEGRLSWLQPYWDQDTAFALWILMVDRVLHKYTGVCVPDLSDFPYRDHFMDGATPGEVAAEVQMTDDLFTILR